MDELERELEAIGREQRRADREFAAWSAVGILVVAMLAATGWAWFGV